MTSRERRILDSWQSNALPWCVAVRENRIDSRVKVTNQAIVDTLLEECRAVNLNSVLDLGCGEGWLVRELNRNGLSAIGVDAVEALIDQARALDPENQNRYNVLSYNDLTKGKLTGTVDAVVANFSLLGDESVQQLFAAMKTILNPGGVFVVQTVHPVLACGDQPYLDGWREESWNGFGVGDFKPAPWFFRTLQSWTSLFFENKLTLTRIKEPLHPETRYPEKKKPASIIFIAKK